MRCLETRKTPQGYTRRRYERGDGVRFTTIEVPLIVWRGINRQGDGDRATQWARARERDAVRLLALQHLNEGWKAIASAHELGVPVRTIQRWRKECR
jgi:hypothetical protein